MKLVRWFLLAAVIFVFPALVLADAPVEGRAGRAEVRFLQGMIDHHQMAVDMANHCLTRATTEEVLAICTAVIAAQTPEIEQMQSWLLEWYGITYTPMSMLAADEHAEHDAAADTDEHAQHEQGGDAMAGMGMDMPMMGGMDGMGMQGMMMQMHQMMMMMQMQAMMMQMHGMMQGMMGGMDMEAMMGNMQGMMDNMQDMMGGMSGMGGMGSMGEGQNQGEHDQHHPEGEAAPAADHSQHEDAAAMTDPSMTMGMMAGLNRAEGIDYDIAWLESMIDHHDDAIHMTTRILQQAEHDELIALAENIVSAQTAENEQMEVLIATLSGG